MERYDSAVICPAKVAHVRAAGKNCTLVALRASVHGLCADLPAHIERIKLKWHELAEDDPWLGTIPTEERWDSLPDALAGLFNSTLCRADSRDPHREHVTGAVKHGADRRRQGSPPDVIFREYAMLREAIWRHVRGLSGTRGEIDAVLLIDGAISLATRASIVGYHQEDFVATGRWDDMVSHLIDESTWAAARSARRTPASALAPKSPG